MILRGNIRRIRALIVLIFSIAAAALGAAFALRQTMWGWGFFGVFVFTVIITSSFIRKFNAGILNLTSESLSLSVGFRSIALKWEHIEAMETTRFMGKTYLGIRLRDLSALERMPHQIALINAERTGYHFCIHGPLFEMPLPEVQSLLASCLTDAGKRANLDSNSKSARSE